MADIAESTPVAEMNTEGAENKEAKTCELATEINEKGDCGVVAGSEAEKETCTEAEAVESAVAEATADTTDACTGTKRKAEDEGEEEPKKSKPDAEAPTATEEPKDSEAVPANGVSSNGDDATNGKAIDDIPPEVVTKTVEDVLKQAEDVDASS